MMPAHSAISRFRRDLTLGTILNALLLGGVFFCTLLGGAFNTLGGDMLMLTVGTADPARYACRLSRNIAAPRLNILVWLRPDRCIVRIVFGADHKG